MASGGLTDASPWWVENFAKGVNRYTARLHPSIKNCEIIEFECVSGDWSALVQWDEKDRALFQWSKYPLNAQTMRMTRSQYDEIKRGPKGADKEANPFDSIMGAKWATERKAMWNPNKSIEYVDESMVPVITIRDGREIRGHTDHHKREDGWVFTVDGVENPYYFHISVEKFNELVRHFAAVSDNVTTSAPSEEHFDFIEELRKL